MTKAKAHILKALLTTTIFITSFSITQAQTPEKVSPESDRKAVAVTIYNDSLALIRETRSLNFDEGINHIALRDVSAHIRPETATLTSEEDANLTLLEQNFDYDLLTPTSLFNKYVGEDITIVTVNPKTDKEVKEKAKILANNDGVVLQYNDRIETGLPANARIQYDKVPENLRDRPTLVASIMSDKTANQLVDLSYLTSGFSWKADYVAELSKDENTLSLAGWVTLTNQSGTDFNNAKLQLIAGDVNRVEDEMVLASEYKSKMADVAKPAPMKQEDLFEYHLYTLDRTTDLRNNQTKQVAMLSAKDVPAHKLYRMSSGGSYWYGDDEVERAQKRDIQVFVSFDNNKLDHLGIPLPKGIVRVYKPDSSGNALFIGEDSIDHTPENQSVTLKLGNAFDVTGTWTRKNYQRISRKIYDQSFEVEISNAKDIPVDVTVVEPINDTWSITAENLKHSKPTSNAAQWVVSVPAKSKSQLKYTVRIRED